MAKTKKTGNTAVAGIQGTSTSKVTTGSRVEDTRTQKQKYIDAYIDAKQGGSSAQEAASTARSTVGMPANAATTTRMPDGFGQGDVVSRNGRLYATDSAQQAYIDRVKATMAQNDWEERQQQNLGDRLLTMAGGATKGYGSDIMNYLGNRMKLLGEKADGFVDWLGKIRTPTLMGVPVSNEWREASGIDREENRLTGENLARQGMMVEDAADAISEEAANDIQNAKAGLSGLGQAGIDIASNLLQMGYDSVMAFLPGGRLGAMYMRSAGSAARKARQAGATTEQQAQYSTLSGGIEVLTEKMADGLAGFYGAGAADVFTERWIRKMTGSNLGRSFLRWIVGAGEEGVEEVVSDLLQPFAEMVYNGKDFRETLQDGYDPSELLYDYFIGAAVGLLGGGVGGVLGGNARANRKAQYADQAESELNRQGVTGSAATRVGEIIASQMMGEDLTRREQRLYDRIPEAADVYQQMQQQREDAYVRAIMGEDQQNRVAAAQQEEIRQLTGRVQGEVDATAIADTGSASIEYDGQRAKVDFVRSDGRNAIQLTMEDGTKKVIEPAEAENAGLDRNVLNLIHILSWAGENAPALYSVYDGEQEVGRYSTAMHQAIDLYAANGVDVRKAAQTARENSRSVTLIGELNDAQLEMAQAIGAKIYRQKQAETKEKSSRLRETRKQAQEAIRNRDINAAETLTAVNSSIREAREYFQSQRAQYSDTVEALQEMQRLGQEDSAEYRDLLEQAQQLRRNVEGTERAIEDLEQERKRQQARQPIRRKRGTVRFDGATDGTVTYDGDGVDQDKLNDKQKAVVETAKDLADVLDMDFVFFRGPAGVGGFYRGGSTIYVNIDSGMGVGKFNKVIAAGSMSHELTHWLQQYAPEEYEELRTYILNDIAEKQGPDALEKLIQQQQQWEKGRQLTRDEAIDEVVANACQTMLRDSKAVSEIAQQHKTLAEKIHDFLQKLVERIKAAFADVDIRDNAPIYDAARAIEASYKEILQLWDKALQEAAQNNWAARETETAEANENAAPEGSVEYQQWQEGDEEPVRQEISSADTSINANKLPVLYTDRNAVFQDGGTNIDIGGGRFDNVTEYLADKGVTNLLFDPYNRPEETNTDTLRYLQDGNRADTATCSNVLNVIAEQAARDNVILEMAKAIKPDGKAYFTVYEGDGEGTGRATKSGWQENRKTATYVPEIQKYFDTVTRKGKLIIAEDPKADLPKAAWETTPGKATRYQQWDEEHPALVAVHNKSVSGLRRMLQRGGVPFPSIAIKKAGSPHEGFGDVSIVFPRSTIDPKVNRQNRLYSNDAWTPTEPLTEYDVDVPYKLKENIKETVGEGGFELLSGYSDLDDDEIAKKLTYNKGDLFEALKDRNVLKYAYLKSIGQDVELPTREKPLDGSYKYDNQQLVHLFETIGEERLQNGSYEDEALLAEIADTLNEQYAEKVTKGDSKAKGKILNAIRRVPLYSADKINLSTIQYALEKYIRDGRQLVTEPDAYQLKRTLQDNTDVEKDPAYRKWIENTFRNIIKGSGIPNNKDPYTNSGNRRSFKQLHEPATLENIVALMQKQSETGNGVFGVNLRGAATRTYGDVEDMRADSKRLLGTHVSDDVYDSYMNDFHSRLSDIVSKAQNNQGFDAYDSTQQILLEVLRDSTSKAQMTRKLSYEDRWIRVYPGLADELWQLKQDVQNMPAPYFEAKPRRIVYPEEAVAFILPDNADQDVMDMLQARYARVLTYEAGNEEDRLAKLNSLSEAQFQRWTDGQISLDEWINGGREERTDLHPDIRARLDAAADLENRVERFFAGMPEDSEYFLTADEIDEMMEVNPFDSGDGAGMMDNAEQIVMNLSEISKDLRGQRKTEAYSLMDALLEYMPVARQTNWTEDRRSRDANFTAWYNRKHQSLYYKGYKPGDLIRNRKNFNREVEHLAKLIRNEEADLSTRRAAAAMLDAMGTRKTTWYQKWSEEQPDLAHEAQGRDMAYTVLQSENDALKDTVKALNELTKKQGATIGKLQQRLKITKTPEVRESDAKKLAGRLIREHSSKADRDQLTQEIKALGDYLLQTEEVDQGELMRQARMIATEIASRAEAPNEMDVEAETAASIVQDIKGKKLLLPEQFRGELDTVGGYNAFRQRNAFNFTLATQEGNAGKEGYTGIDQFYTGLQRSWGKAYFPDVANEGEQIQIVADMFDRARPALVNPYEHYMGEAVEAIANDIVQDALSGILRPTPPTTADRWASRYQQLRERIRDLQQQGALDEKEAQNLRETVYDLSLALDQADSRYRTLRINMRERLAQVEAEGRARAAERLAQQKARENEKIAGLKQYYQEQARRARERREENKGIRKYREQVIDKAKKLSDWLLKNSDKEHVPEVLKAPLLEFLTSIDYTSQRALNGGEETAADRKFGARLQRLQQLLSNQQSYINGDDSIQEDLGGYIDVSPDMLQFLRETAEKVTKAMNTGTDYTINRMNASELQDLSKLLSALSSGIRNMNALMANARYKTVREAASQDIEYMASLGKAPDSAGSGISKFLQWKHATPYYAMKRFGTGGQAIFDGLTSGWEKLAFHAREIIEFTESAYTDKEVNAWKKQIHSIELEDGSNIRMTTAQIMELMQLLKREQALKHIEAGGIRIGNIEAGKGLKAATVTDTTHYHLTEGDISNILSCLTTRQADVANKLQRYMAQRGAEWGNEISMKRFGYNFYTEGENYYPIKTDSNDRAMQDTDAQQNSMFRLLNLSSSKAINPKASNALVVGDIFDTFSDHMADQAKLNALGLPILDAIKWFNFKERINNDGGTYDTRTLQAAMEQAYQGKAQHYFRTLMKDINGVTESGDRGTDVASKLASNYKVASVGANLRVALLQPTSYVRALTLISPRNLMRAFAYKNGYEEAMKYSGTAVWKSLGYYDTNISRSMRQQIQHNETWKDKAQEASMKGAELGDSRTWGRLWTACKLQEQELHPDLDGDRLMQATAELFRGVVYSSQVMDSTLTRSELMRGRTQYTKALTAFMAEPTLSYNVLLDAYSEYQNDVRRHGKQGAWKRNQDKIGRAFTVYVASATVSAIAESLIDAVRDDDDYETFLQKFMQAMFGEGNPIEGNWVQDLLITGKIPYAKSIVNKLAGFSSSSDMSMEWLDAIFQAWQIWRETVELEAGLLDKPTKVTYYGNMTNWGKIYKTLQALSQLTGLPVSAAMRDVFAIWNTTAGSIVPYWKIKTYDAGTKSNVKQALGSGYLTEEEATQILLDEGVYTSAEAAGRDVFKWSENAGSAYEPLFRAIRKGDAEEAARLRQSMAGHGYGEGTVNSKIKQEVKEWFLDEGMDKTEAMNTLVNYAGMSARDAGLKLDWWETLQANPQIDADGNGSAKQDEVGAWLRQEVNAGRITAARAGELWTGVTAGDASPWKKTWEEWLSKH